MIQTQAQAARDLIETLVAGGVRSAVISPGSRNTPLVLAAEACAGLRCHVAIDERVAGFMALGMSRVSGCPTLLICTSGSALAPSSSGGPRRARPIRVILAPRRWSSPTVAPSAQSSRGLAFCAALVALATRADERGARPGQPPVAKR